MIKLRNMLVAMIAITALSTSAYAGSVGFGVTGSLAAIGASGHESEGGAAPTDSSSAMSHNNTMIGSIFAEYIFDGMNGVAIGVDYIPGSAAVNADTLTRTDIETSKDATVASTSNSLKRTAKAEVENHMTIYLEVPMHAGLYAKVGHTKMDVNTLETLTGGSSYGNTDVSGTVVGLGYKHDSGGSWYYKLEGTHTDFDSLIITEKNQSLGATNTIKADLDVTRATFALGYKF